MSSLPASAGRVALLLGLLVALTIIGSSAVAVALDSVARDLSLDTAGAAWVMAAFALAFSVATALFGRLADLHGLRRTLRIGGSIFVAGSLFAALAWSFPSLVVARLVQGAGAGSVPVLAVSILAARFTGAARSRALGALTAVVSVVSGSGPLIGGLLTELLSWRAVLAVPILAAALIEPVARVAPDTPTASGRLDWLGAALVAATTTGIVLLLQAPATGAGLATVAGAAALATAGGLGLRRRVARRPDGFLPRRLLANRPLVLGALTGMTLLGAYLAMLLALPLQLAADQGWGPGRIGVALLPAAVLGAVASRVTGGWAVRLGRFRVVAVLAAGSAGGMLLAAAGHASPALVVAGLTFVVVGFAAGQVALLDAIPLLVPVESQGLALGLFNLVFFTGGAVGSALVGGLGDALGLPGAIACAAVLPAAGAVLALVGRRAVQDPAGSSPRRTLAAASSACSDLPPATHSS